MEWVNSFVSRSAIATPLVVMLLGAGPVAEADHAVLAAGASVSADPCDINRRLNQLATFYISDCRQASIRRVFPGQHLYDSVKSIKEGRTASERTAWKLLNDSRFKKPR